MARPMIVSVDSLIVEITGGAGPAGPAGVDGDGWVEVTLVEETGTYFYFGGLKLSGAWQVNRWTKASLGSGAVRATVTNNSLVTTLASAWTNRATLTYA